MYFDSLNHFYFAIIGLSAIDPGHYVLVQSLKYFAGFNYN